jgi:hypothetical protein
MNTKCSMYNQPTAVHPGPPTRSKKESVRIQQGADRKGGGTTCEPRKKHGRGGSRYVRRFPLCAVNESDTA